MQCGPQATLSIDKQREHVVVPQALCPIETPEHAAGVVHDQEAAPLGRVQRLQHQPVAAQGDDHVRHLDRALAVAQDQPVARRLGEVDRARHEMDALEPQVARSRSALRAPLSPAAPANSRPTARDGGSELTSTIEAADQAAASPVRCASRIASASG